MVSNAVSVVLILPNTKAFHSAEGPLGISEYNIPIMRFLCSHCVEIDDERWALDQGHLRCEFSTAELENNGRALRIIPLPSKFKMRKGSTANIFTSADDHHGAVK